MHPTIQQFRHGDLGPTHHGIRLGDDHVDPFHGIGMTIVTGQGDHLIQMIHECFQGTVRGVFRRPIGTRRIPHHRGRPYRTSIGTNLYGTIEIGHVPKELRHHSLGGRRASFGRIQAESLEQSDPDDTDGGLVNVQKRHGVGSTHPHNGPVRYDHHFRHGVDNGRLDHLFDGRYIGHIGQTGKVGNSNFGGMQERVLNGRHQQGGFHEGLTIDQESPTKGNGLYPKGPQGTRELNVTGGLPTNGNNHGNIGLLRDGIDLVTLTDPDGIELRRDMSQGNVCESQIPQQQWRLS